MRGKRPEKQPQGEAPMRNPGQIIQKVIHYVLKLYPFQYILVFFCILANVFANIQGTLFLQTLIDDYIVPIANSVAHGEAADYSGLLQAILRVMIFYAIGVVASFAQRRILIIVSQGTLRQIRKDIFEKMESLPLRYFDTHSHGGIMSIYTNDVDTMQQMIGESMPMMLMSLLTIVGVLYGMIRLSPTLTGVAVLMVILMVITSTKTAKISGKYFMQQQKQLASVNGYVEEYINGQKVIKVFNHENQCREDFRKINDELFNASFNANAYANYLGPINSQMGNLSYVVCVTVGAAMAITGFGGMTLGGLASFLTFVKNLNSPIFQISMQMNAVIMGMAGAERVFRFMDEKPEEDEGYVTLVRAREEKDGSLTECSERTGTWAWKHYHKEDNTTTYTKLQGGIVMEHVNFGYEADHPVLHDIELYAKPGQKIAFVGSTGAGKTTITNLINRFYDVDDGKIRYDGINIRKIKKADLRRSLGMVLQDTHLFTNTVRENIRYGRLDATDEEVEKAAKLANADGFIQRLPEGYDTMLTSDGASLSQGQRQLLSIARAAVANPPALILDEATSSIDTYTEQLVQEGMDRLMKDRTTFVIAHRLSTVRNADCIMVLEQGRIIERGTHSQLLEKQGRYYELYTGNKAAVQPVSEPENA
jgi:ATP-binding cassette subfamily B multidrug efflux pump